MVDIQSPTDEIRRGKKIERKKKKKPQDENALLHRATIMMNICGVNRIKLNQLV